MIEVLLFCLFWLVVLLVVVGAVLAQYVLVPGVLLRAFFRSEWAPPGLKNVVGWSLGGLALLLVGAYAWSWHIQRRAHREAADPPRFPPVQLTARQPGLLPFRLGRGGIEEARYDTVRRLVVSGDLSVGGRLRARFAASPDFAVPNETNTVAVSTEQGSATQATGRSVYDPSTGTVSGSFRCVLPSGKQLSVTFSPAPAVLPGSKR